MRKILFFIAVSIATSLTFFFTFNSCEKENISFSDDSKDELTIEGNLFDVSTMSSNDYLAVEKALDRMNMHFVNGKYETNGLSAKQLGISDNLQLQLQIKIAESNGEEKSIRNLRKRLKRAGEDIKYPQTDSDSLKTPVNCVPILINTVIQDFGAANIPSVEDIISWCSENEYYVPKQGVPPNFFGNVINHFLNGRQVNISSLPINYAFNKETITSNKYYIMSSSKYGGHAVRIEWFKRSESSGEITLIGYNPQEGKSTFYNASDVIEIYEIFGLN